MGHRKLTKQSEARRKYLQMDMAQRIKAKEVELSRRQQEVGHLGRVHGSQVAATVAEARETALDARLKLTWKGG